MTLEMLLLEYVLRWECDIRVIHNLDFSDGHDRQFNREADWISERSLFHLSTQQPKKPQDVIYYLTTGNLTPSFKVRRHVLGCTSQPRQHFACVISIGLFTPLAKLASTPVVIFFHGDGIPDNQRAACATDSPADRRGLSFQVQSQPQVLLTASDEIGSYIKEIKLEGFGYHLVAVFGSQSTGKSIKEKSWFSTNGKGTLLNRLFGTKFDVMDETQRKQTTKGTFLCVFRVF